MKQETKKETKPKKKTTKATIKRITALLFALLLITATLSPSIITHASDDDDWTSAGAGGTVGGITETSSPTITDNDDGTRTLTLKLYSALLQDGENFIGYKWRMKLTGSGRFVIRSFTWNYENGKKNPYGIMSYIFSDKSFTITTTQTDVVKNTTSTGTPANAQFYNGVYYYSLPGMTGSFDVGKGFSFTYNGYVNVKHVTDTYPSVKELIDSGDLDLTKDDWEPPSETLAVYNKDLDFASISADYKVKYTIEKNNEGHFEFISPNEAGIQFDWINRTDIDGAYVRFNVYGEYYDSFWGTSYTNTYVTFVCNRKNDLTYLCKQKDMISMAKEKCNGSKGYGFVVNYIYVQAFANIDGTMCRSRIYKFNSDLVSDYGNADSEDDEWVPEVTGGDSMPEDYEPDPENPDPEKTEPEPDGDDDTIIDTPVDDEDVVINDDTTYLEAFKQFIKVIKQGIVYLGDFPLLVSSVFSFIPPIFLIFIGAGFAVALILRFLGR